MGGRMDSAQIVEAYLRAERADRIEKKILKSEVLVIDNLLQNTLAARSAYDEILVKASPANCETGGRAPAWHHVVNTILSTAAFFSPEQLSGRRDDLRRCAELSADISKKAQELARLLRTRTAYKNANGVSVPDDSHPLDVLARAAAKSGCAYLFEAWIAPRLDPIRNDFDLKYWPRTADFLEALAREQEYPIEPADRIDASAMESRQGNSPRDFVRALDEALTELHEQDGIGTDFSHRTIAEIANCALNLPAENALTRDSVKALRAYQRRRG